MNSVAETRVIDSVADYRVWRSQQVSDAAKAEKPLVGIVPTMGALHDGHMTLIRRAVRECQNVVVTIFVNPMQFGPNEDFDRYPKTFEKDLAFCRSAGVSVVFSPSVDEIYSTGHNSSTKVVPPAELTDRLCGTFRPGHFIGVATVVLKLFSIVQPEQAYFGEKDYQQLTIIRRMITDLDLPIKIVSVPTVRESDGLALSSRNVNLSSDERKRAPELYRTLCVVREDALSGRRPLDEALKFAREKLSKVPEFALQYLEACDPHTLEPLKELKTPMVLLVAAKLGSVRLIDNLIVG
ncbi:MAG: pantoate--beta-alanine ligase [Candidatus Obscuribacterales bacterium]|nr:pantoate--beta-alanine ligase [Candidatus Obscuribacterales bacterium]